MAKSTTPDGRTSLVIDHETKAVFDWSLEEQKSKNVTAHLKKLLLDEHSIKEWTELVRKAQNKRIICEFHNKPTTMYCNKCKATLCPECDVSNHIGKGHDLLNFCRIHQTGYRGSCLLCESERWEGIVDIPKISVQGLKVALDKKTPIAIIDLRNDYEFEQGHLPQKILHNHTEFKFLSLHMDDEFKKLCDFIQENKDKMIITMGQSMPKKDKIASGSARGFIAAAQIQVMFKVKNIRYLDGGWSAFHYCYPELVNNEHKKEECKICRFYDRT